MGGHVPSTIPAPVGHPTAATTGFYHLNEDFRFQAGESEWPIPSFNEGQGLFQVDSGETSHIRLLPGLLLPLAPHLSQVPGRDAELKGP